MLMTCGFVGCARPRNGKRPAQIMIIRCPRGDLNSRDSGHIGQHQVALRRPLTSQNRLLPPI